MNIIKLRNVTKKYDKLKAVDDISFNVLDGETFGILGPNGAGKTTTLEMIETLRSISKGVILVDDIDVAKHPERVKSIIGVQLQSTAYFDRLKLIEIIDLFASFYKQQVDAKKLLAEVGLEQKINSYVSNLSGGQQQRFSIASTLVNDPKIVFLDEPTTGLDPQARRNIWQLIKQIRNNNQTIILTTHYMDEAQLLCDRIAIMDNGKIIALDTPNKLIKKYGSGSIISFKLKNNHKINQKIKFADKISYDDDNYCKISTKNEMGTIKDLIKLEKKLTIQDLSLHPSTLEDVFLNLTGKKLRS